MPTIRKIDLMHRMFGLNPEYTCGECNNLIEYAHRSKTYRKCKVYGRTASEATDWAKRYIACGKFNQEHKGREIVRLVRVMREKKQKDCVLPGQIKFEEIGGNNEQAKHKNKR